jgi:uncharacterized BrkB/YihY/UPF0761 family membrane protein
MNPNNLPSTREDTQLGDNPPFSARLGCGLLVGTLLVVIFAAGVFLYSMNAAYLFILNFQQNGADGAKVWLDYMGSIQQQERVGTGVAVAAGMIVAGSVIAALESSKVLIWLRRR